MSSNVMSTNRRARRDFEVLETVEAGIVLAGSEVKSIRQSKVELAEAYAQVRRGEVWLMKLTIPPYEHSNRAFDEDPARPRKLLLNRREIERLSSQLQQQPLTLIVLSLYFNGKNVKVELALARRRKQHDKRRQIAERDAEQEKSQR